MRAAGRFAPVRWPRGEHGSVLMLVPAGILVLLLLAAIAVDAAIVLAAERDLAHRTAAVAGDVANAAVDDERLYGAGAVELRPDLAAAHVAVAFPSEEPPAGYVSWTASAQTEGRRVTVSATAEVRYLFASAVPGGPRSTTVAASSTAEAAG